MRACYAKLAMLEWPMCILLLLLPPGHQGAAISHHTGNYIKQGATQMHATRAAPLQAGQHTQHDSLKDAVRESCLRFLIRHMPKHDRYHMSRHQLLLNVESALAARQANPWAAAVPWDVFLNDMLPYASLDEPRDGNIIRPLFARLFSPLVADAVSITDAAQRLNRDIWGMWGIVFKADQTPEIMSPTQVIHAGYASCTGLSIFLVAACRAVGIPARVAGTPSWVTTRTSRHAQDVNHDWNNHNWVEIWDGGQWSFVGAAEYDSRGMNRTWFFPHPAKDQVPGDRWHAIYAASFAATSSCNTTFPLVWDDKWETPACDVTRSYLDAAVPS